MLLFFRFAWIFGSGVLLGQWRSTRPVCQFASGGFWMRVLAVAVCCFLASVAAFAHSDRGNITGTVSDPANAVVPNANITAANLETGGQFKTTTSATGNYTLASLPPGRYEMTVEVAGFKKFTQQG